MCAPSNEANKAVCAQWYFLYHSVSHMSGPSEHVSMAGGALIQKTIFFAAFCEHTVRSKERGEHGQLRRMLFSAALCEPRMLDRTSDAPKMLHWPANWSRTGGFAWVFGVRIARMIFFAIHWARPGGNSQIVSGAGFIIL